MDFIEAWQSTGWTFGKIMIIFWFVFFILIAVILFLTNRKVKVENWGNTAANILNEGLFAQGGDWIYFSNYRCGNTLCKKKLLGCGESAISRDVQARYINVLDDWVFYSAIPREKQMTSDLLLDNNRYLFKVKADGSKRTQLNSHNTLNVQVTGDWIYYTHNSEGENFHLYRIGVDGLNQTLIKSDVGINACIVDGWAYYSIEDGIFRIRTNGKGNIRISEERASYMNIVGEWIYYRNLLGGKGYLYRIRTNGTERTRLNQDDSTNIIVAGNWVYYINMNDRWNIYRVNIDGSNRTRINKTRTTVFNILDGKIFYLAEDDVPYWIPIDEVIATAPKEKDRLLI